MTYTDADTKTAARYGLPVGMLGAIRTAGEKTNADRVSSAGARTPYQITPETRAAILKQYGIDAYLSPETASEAAGILLRDSLQRGGGDPERAVREYHGGTDPKNWGKINQAYWERVSAGMRDTAVKAAADEFGAWMAANPAQAAPKPAQAPAAPDAAVSDFHAWLKGSDQVPQAPIPADRRPPALGIPPAAAKPDEGPGLLGKALGTGEAALSAVTGATGGALGMAGGLLGGIAGSVASGQFGSPQAADDVERLAAEGAQRLTYAPRTESGQQQAAALGEVMNQAVLPAVASGLRMPSGALPAAARGVQVPAAAVLDRAGAILQPKEAAPVVAPVPARAVAPRPAVRPPAEAPQAAATAEAPPVPAQEAGKPIPTLDQYVALRKVAAEPMPPEIRGGFLAWIRARGGISMAEKLDITGERSGVLSNPAGIFKRGGRGSDDLASMAADEGYLRPDLAGDSGAFRDLVKNAISGERVLTMEEQGMKAARDDHAFYLTDRTKAAEDRARSLGVDPAPAKGDFKVLEAYLDRHEPALLAAAVDEARPAQPLPVQADELAFNAKQIARDIEDGGRTLAQYEAEIRPLSPVMRKLVADELGQPLPQAPAPVAVAAPAVAAPTPAAPPARRVVAAERDVPRGMTAEGLAKTARMAGEGGAGAKKAAQVLATEAAPSRATVKAAQRLGIGEYLQADHVTTNEAYRQIVAAIKSNPQSKIALAEREGLARVAERATQMIDEIGGTTDASAVSNTVKAGLQKAQAVLDTRAEALYAKLRREIPAKAEAPADSVLAFVAQRADELGGARNLSPMERMIAAKLAPEDGVPTYALLDDVRQQVGDAIKGRGQFKDAGSGLAKKLYAELSKDQAAVAERHGMADVFDMARAVVRQRKAIEDDLVALFGRDLDRSIAGGGENGLAGAFAVLAKGDSARLVRLLEAVPQELRPHVVASGLATVFRKMGTRGELDFTGFAKWYEGLRRNRQAYSALSAQLPLSARKQIEALYRVSKGVSESLNRRTKTGALSTIKAEMIGADTLMENLFSVARRAGAGVAAEAVTTPLGLPGAGLSAAIASALTKGKPRALSAIDELIASPEFEQMARAEAGPQQQHAARRLVLAPAFKRFANAVGNQPELKDPEGWVLDAMRVPVPQQQSQDRRSAGNTIH